MIGASTGVDHMTLLLVDDEENILNSLRRVLRAEPYTLKVASNGDEALQILENCPVDLVVSDARMPGMDGATLLAQVQERWPNCMRVLLTGYADISTTIKAINEGRIYRYVSKPWDDQELRLVIKQALAHQYSERERARLEKLTQDQNLQLQRLNESLEQRVIARTAELQQTAEMLDLAYEELRKSYITATEVFSSLISQRLSKERQTNAEVIALVKAYSDNYGLDSGVANDLSMAAALYNVGKLTWDDQLLSKPSDLLYKDDRARYRKYPEIGESLLMTLEPLQDAGRLIRHHQERWDGQGYPDRLEGEQIPLGARVLRLAVDFLELQRGLILERRVSRDDALRLIEKHAGRLYDPEISKQFVELCSTLAPDLGVDDPSIVPVDTRKLEPGMVLARNLYASNGTLLLNDGKVLTQSLINKLTAFEASEDARYTLMVRLPKKDD
ncbi:response regulator [Pseudomonas chloritidismutans]|uniref:Response regulator n=1 Tax=Stutzerimonas chloritidismutans TaxID=203192 RepID=A0ACC5VGB9_STUCH|nr:response regulator [Stutzerimonas chloritidismutans]